MSLCAPFLAFDPVMQLVVGQLFMPVLCPLIGLGCDEVGAAYPWRHIAALGSVVAGAFFLSISAKQAPPRRYVFSRLLATLSGPRSVNGMSIPHLARMRG